MNNDCQAFETSHFIHFMWSCLPDASDRFQKMQLFMRPPGAGSLIWIGIHPHDNSCKDEMVDGSRLHESGAHAFVEHVERFTPGQPRLAEASQPETRLPSHKLAGAPVRQTKASLPPPGLCTPAGLKLKVCNLCKYATLHLVSYERQVVGDGKLAAHLNAWLNAT